LFDGVLLTTLTPGDLITDISWRLVPKFSGGNVNFPPTIVYLGTSEINLLHRPGGNNLDNPTDDFPSSTLPLDYDDTYDAVGDWLVPAGNIPLSICGMVGDQGNWTGWSSGVWIPDTEDLDLIVKIKGQDLNNAVASIVDTSASGVVEFYLHTQ
jgi:hypothetical protein